MSMGNGNEISGLQSTISPHSTFSILFTSGTTGTISFQYKILIKLKFFLYKFLIIRFTKSSEAIAF